MKSLFVTDKKNIDYTIPGGVQICTREFKEYFEMAGYTVIDYSLSTTNSLFKKVKIKLGLEVYNRYDFEEHVDTILTIVNNENIKIIALNQLNLTPLVAKLKPYVSNDVKFIGLSHGNESGDYLHDITKSKPSSLEIWKLGKQLICENLFFTSLLNGIIVISEQEISINNWLGALNILFLPRLLKPNFVEWKPDPKRIGFVGTLDHLPNAKGLRLVAHELVQKKFDGKLRLIGGPVNFGKKLEKEFRFIEYCGRLSEIELLDEIKTWAIFLNPVFWFSRGSSTKLSQAINLGIPIISTPAGRRGYDLCDEEIIVNNHFPKTFASAIIEALNNDSVLESLKRSSEFNATQFDTKTWVKKLMVFLENVPVSNIADSLRLPKFYLK